MKTETWQKTFSEYLNELTYPGITEDEKQYLLETYIEDVEKAIGKGIEVDARIQNKLINLSKELNRRNKVEDNVLRVDDRAIVKGKNGNPDFEGSFRGWFNDNAIVWIESIGAQLSVEKSDVSKKMVLAL